MTMLLFLCVLHVGAVEILFERLRTNDVALFGAELRIFEIEVKLRSCELVIAAGIRDPCASREPRRERRTDLVSVKAHQFIAFSTSHLACQTTPVTEMKCNHAIRLTRHDPKWRSNFLSLRICDLDEGHVVFAAFHRAPIVRRVRNQLRGIRTDDRDVVPGDFRQYPGKFPQPAVFCEAPVVNRGIGTEDNLKRTCRWLLLRLSLLTGPTRIQ